MAINDLDAASGGLIQYGKFKFNDAVTETTALTITPQFDAGKRTVTHSVYQIELLTRLSGNPTDDAVQTAVAELQRAGQPFRYTGHGCGNLRVNVGGARAKDVLWGPLPGPVRLRPVGGKRVCELSWSVSVSVPTCDDAVYAFSPLEFSYSLSFGIAANRLTTRTYKATLRVPNNRLPIGGRLMLDNPDLYREQIAPPVPVGFTIESEHYEVDESRTRLTATIVHAEMGQNCLPLGIIVGEAEHSFSSVPNNFGTMWTGSVSATFEVPKPEGIKPAIVAFLAMANRRIFAARDIPNGLGVPGARVDLAKKVVILPTGFSVAEPKIFGRNGLTGRFSLSYSVTSAGWGPILTQAGLWTPEGAPPNFWKVSVIDALGPRGVAGMRFNSNEDELVDLCGKVTPEVPVAPPPRAITGGGGVIGGGIADIVGRLKADPGIDAAILNAFPPPGPGEGWLELRCWATTEEDHGAVVGRALPKKPIADRPDNGVWDILKDARPSADGPQPVYPNAADYQIPNQSPSQRGSEIQVQRRATPLGILSVVGYAFRWGRPIPCPVVEDVNGVPVTPVGRLDQGEGFQHGIIGHAILPVYYARWNLRYEATRAIQQSGPFPVPPNILG